MKREMQGRMLISPPQARISNVMTTSMPRVKERVSSPRQVPSTAREASSSSSSSEGESDDDVVITGIFTSSAPKRRRTAEPPPPSGPAPTPPLPRPVQAGTDRTTVKVEREKGSTPRRRSVLEEEYLKKCQLKINSARRELELYEERVSKALSAIRSGEKKPDAGLEKAQKSCGYPSVDLVNDDELAIVDRTPAPEPSTSVSSSATDTALKRLKNNSMLPSAIFDHDYTQAPPRHSPKKSHPVPPRTSAPLLSLNSSSVMAPPVAKTIPPSELHSGVSLRTVRVARSSLLPSAVSSPAIRELPVSSHFLVSSSNQVQPPLISRSANCIIPNLTQGFSLPKSSGPSSPNRSPPVLLAQNLPTEQLLVSMTPDAITPPVLFPQPPVLQPDPQIIDGPSDSEFYGDVIEVDADCPPPPLMPCLGVDTPFPTPHAVSKANPGFGVPVVDGISRKFSQNQNTFSAVKPPSTILNRNTCFILQSKPKVMKPQRTAQSLAPPILIPEQCLNSKDMSEQALKSPHRRSSLGNPTPFASGHKRYDMSFQLKPSQAKPASALLSAVKAKKCLSQPPSPAAKVTSIPVSRKPKRAQAVFHSDSQSAKIQRLSQPSSPDRLPSVSTLTKQVKVFQSCLGDENQMTSAAEESPAPPEDTKSLSQGDLPPTLASYRAGIPATSSSAPRKLQQQPSDSEFRIDLTSSPEAS